MRVLPWNQSERVQETIGGLPLASSKQESRGCASFICSWCASTGTDGSSTLKVEAVHPSNFQGDGSSILPSAPPPISAHVAPQAISRAEATNGEGRGYQVSLKSNLKKPSGAPSGVVGSENIRSQSGSPNRANAGAEQGISVPNCNRERKVQWTDAHGQELAQIKEFELSDSCGSDDEDDGEANQGCACVIQ